MKSDDLKWFGVKLGIVILAIDWFGTAEGIRQWRNYNAEEVSTEATTERIIANNSGVSSGHDERMPKQEEGDVDDASEALSSIPPHLILPQVAQILNAIFSGSFNITQSVGHTLVSLPILNPVKNRVGGVFNRLLSRATTEAGELSPAIEEDPLSVQVLPSEGGQKGDPVRVTTVGNAFRAEEEQQTGSTIPKYKIKSRTKPTSTISSVDQNLEDDEAEKFKKPEKYDIHLANFLKV